MKQFIEEASLAAHEKQYDECAQILVNEFIKGKPKVNPGEGLAYLNRIIPGMLSRRMYADVAHILWGGNLFSAEPESVKLIWDEIQQTATLLVQGAGALGKSYNLAAFFLLDWLEDPLWTCIKVVSVTAAHAQKNVFAHIKNLHRQSSIPLPGHHSATGIQASDDGKQGIHLVAIPQGQDGSGRLQGFHPVPRKILHAKFGSLSRVRVILDEGEEVPQGVWEDVDNMLITIEGIEHIKIGVAANPRDIDSKFGKRCKPVGGWSEVDIETSIKWKSEMGWSVVRLDGARCENVKQRKVIFPGLLSYDGYMRYVKQGDTSSEYYTMARGWFPSKGLVINVIPREFMERAVGRLNFTGPITYLASVDLAFEGIDTAPLTVGRFGMATGYNFKGKIIPFPKPKWALQAESQFDLIKEDPSGKMTQTPWLSHQVKMHCKTLNIKAYWLIVDRTGNGTGVHDTLRSDPPEGLGDEVVGIHYGLAATDMRLFAESTQKASELYDGIVTELFFAVRNFLEMDYLKISPSMDIDSLTEQLCTRRFKNGRAKLVRVESKGEYKARGNPSPDKADSLSLLVHLVRMREGFEAMLTATGGRREDYDPLGEDIVGAIPYMKWNE
jgi:hypothetical protein